MSEYDVIVVGVGPVGATAALLLAEAGLTVAAVERDAQVYKLPRAVNLDGEIVRAFQRIGRGEAVDALMQTTRPGDRAGFANSRREWLFGSESRNFGANGWQPANMFDQPEFEAYLRQEAVGHDRVHALVGYEAVAFEDYADGVRVQVQQVGDDEGQTLAGRYLLACDGASSPTRKTLGIGWHDLGYDHDWLVVDVIAKEGHTLTNDVLQVCDPDRISTYVCTKDPYRRWEFKLNPGETAQQMLEPEMVHSLIDPWTPRHTYDIRRTAVYQFHAAVADTWRVGNVFIAGDAAHQTPPFLGQGMNAGMRDVINLAWKLPLVIHGVAGETLLDTYQEERDAHARDLVEWAVSVGRLMEHLTEVERAERRGLPPPATPPALRASGYGQGREQPPIRAGAVRLEQVSDEGSTGYLFNQPIVRDAQGVEQRLDELLGPGFALVARSAPQLSDASHRILDALGARVVSLQGLQPVRGHFDRLFEEHQVALVRPDRIVFGHTTDTLTADALVASLAEALSLSS